MTLEGSNDRRTRRRIGRATAALGAAIGLLAVASAALAAAPPSPPPPPPPPPPPVTTTVTTPSASKVTPSGAVRVLSIVRSGATVRVTVACTASGQLSLQTASGTQLHAPQSFTCSPAGSAHTTFHLTPRGRQLAGRGSLRATFQGAGDERDSTS